MPGAYRAALLGAIFKSAPPPSSNPAACRCCGATRPDDNSVAPLVCVKADPRHGGSGRIDHVLRAASSNFLPFGPKLPERVAFFVVTLNRKSVTWVSAGNAIRSVP